MWAAVALLLASMVLVHQPCHDYHLRERRCQQAASEAPGPSNGAPPKRKKSKRVVVRIRMVAKHREFLAMLAGRARKGHTKGSGKARCEVCKGKTARDIKKQLPGSFRAVAVGKEIGGVWNRRWSLNKNCGALLDYIACNVLVRAACVGVRHVNREQFMKPVVDRKGDSDDIFHCMRAKRNLGQGFYKSRVGATDEGYIRMYLGKDTNGKMVCEGVHVVICALFHGLHVGCPVVLHHYNCHPDCLNPLHLRPGTQSENMSDRWHKVHNRGKHV
jgi:hypothetical protein